MVVVSPALRRTLRGRVHHDVRLKHPVTRSGPVGNDLRSTLVGTRPRRTETTMLLDLDIRDRRVVIFGERGAAAAAARRFARAGARVRLVVVDPASPDESLTGVFRLPQPEVSDTPALLRLLAPAWLVVTAGPPSELGDRVRLLSGQLKIVHTHQSPGPAEPQGRVVLVGGGPGTTRLLTLEACEALLDADVVFYDRLAPTDDLARLAPRGRADRRRQAAVPPPHQSGPDRGADHRACPAGPTGGPPERRGPVRLRAGRRGDPGLPGRRRRGPGRAGGDQRGRRPGGGGHPGDASRREPRVHRPGPATSPRRARS